MTWQYATVLLQIPEGEDKAAFNSHNSALKGEFKKAKPNKAVVAALMKQSFAMRRNNILQQARPLNEILELYPFLTYCLSWRNQTSFMI